LHFGKFYIEKKVQTLRSLSVGYFFIVQVVGVGSAPGFKKINCHVFSQRIKKLLVLTLG
jgi:hypothetical protein